MRIFLAVFVFLAVATVSILGFRGSLSEKPPLEVFPDMDRQAKYKPQAENSFFEDGRNDRPIPANTVARGDFLDYETVFSPDYQNTVQGNSVFLYGKNPDGSFADMFPLEADFELIELGREQYDIHCVTCHGPAGDGNGVTKRYGILATSYHSDRLRNETDGYIYDVISNGKGLMYGLKGRMTPKERWAVVLYMRALQRSQNASATDLPEAQKAELGI